MKIYDFKENLIIKKLQKKEKTILHSDSQSKIYTVSGKFIGEVCLVELPLVGKVFMCDKYQIRGDVIIATTLEDNYVSIINTKTGNKIKAHGIETLEDMAIVTLENGSRRFINQKGEIEDAEIGKGGFMPLKHSDDEFVFVDENGNMVRSNQTFVDYQGRVHAGENDIETENGIYHAVSYNKGEVVKYSFLGNEIEKTDIGGVEVFATTKYKHLYQFYIGKRKLDALNDEYLLDANVYNFVVDEVNKRLQNKFAESEKIKGYYDKTTQQILVKLEQTLRELEERRQLALENSVNQTLENNTF